jgi:hypothetical protein
MFVSANQIYVFIACVFFGGTVGVLFSLSSLIKSKIKNEWLKLVPDVASFIITAFFYVLYAYKMNFPNLRLYMVLGVLIGIIAYFKSFHLLLAKFIKMAYNIIKRKKVNVKDDRR